MNVEPANGSTLPGTLPKVRRFDVQANGSTFIRGANGEYQAVVQGRSAGPMQVRLTVLSIDCWK